MKKAELHKTYSTTLVFVLALLIFYQITKNEPLFWASIGLLITGLVFPDINRIITYYWLESALFLGKINSIILLTLIFYFFLTPLALCYRVFNKKIIAKVTTNNAKSYFEKNFKPIEPNTFVTQW